MGNPSTPFVTSSAYRGRVQQRPLTTSGKGASTKTQSLSRAKPRVWPCYLWTALTIGIFDQSQRLRPSRCFMIDLSTAPLDLLDGIACMADVCFCKYVGVYQNVPHWKDLLGTANRHLALDPAGSLRILDLGSGGGNTVFALLELYPKARMIASDLSVPLLRILKANLERHHEAMSCAIVQMNAEQIVFRDDQMDLVVGGSILHHLLTPEKTLRECYRVLKPGGSAVFFEPFELGNQILALIFKQLIRRTGGSSSALAWA